VIAFSWDFRGGNEENDENFQRVLLLSPPIFEPSTSRIKFRNATACADSRPARVSKPILYIHIFIYIFIFFVFIYLWHAYSVKLCSGLLEGLSSETMAKIWNCQNFRLKFSKGFFFYHSVFWVAIERFGRLVYDAASVVTCLPNFRREVPYSSWSLYFRRQHDVSRD
jgi:hypothetical protein